MKNNSDNIKELIYKILGINETEYKLRSTPEKILSSITSLHICIHDIDIIIDDVGDDPNSVELLYNIRSEILKNSQNLICLWEVTDNLSKANLNKDRELLFQIMPRLTRIRERV